MSRNSRRPTQGDFCRLIAALALFFGLFFGLNYPEIVRHGWPLAGCNVLDAKLWTRYCCETSCKTSSCSSAPSGSPLCYPLIPQLNSAYSPSACLANSSACPPGIGSICDGGNYCCDPCRDISCCRSSDHLNCTLLCPTCYQVDLTLSYKTRQGVLVSGVAFSQDFKKNNSSAVTFFNEHRPQSTAYCYYNPRHLQHVLYNVRFTRWKWVITAVFGMFPLALFLYICAAAFGVKPIVRFYDWTVNNIIRCYDWTIDNIIRWYRWAVNTTIRFYDWTVHTITHWYRWIIGLIIHGYNWITVNGRRIWPRPWLLAKLKAIRGWGGRKTKPMDQE